MKIHIVQKGDTLWEIAKKYGVDFHELKAVNTQLSNPDMIMPGMKIKVPTGNVHVKKEAQIGGVKKEAQIIPTPKKEQQIQPLPFIVEEEISEVEVAPIIPQMPQMPQMPITPPHMLIMAKMPAAPPPQMPVMPQMPQYQPLEIDINNYNLMQASMPQFPTPPQNILPGMMAPEEEDFGPEENFETGMPQMPQAQQIPQMPLQQGPMFNNCVPMTPVMPGDGFNFVPGFQGGFPPQGPFNPMGGFPRTEGVKKEQVKEHMAPPVQMAPVPMAPVPIPQQQPFEIDINNFNIMQAQMAQMAQMPQMVAGVEDEMEELSEMPQMAPMQAPPLPMGPCVPVSPVMPGSGFNGGFPGAGPVPMPFGPGMPLQAVPQGINPAMSNNPFGGPGPGYAGQMNPQMMPSQFYNRKDCGCGGPKSPFVGQFPQQGFPMGQPGLPGQFPQQGFPMGQPGLPGQFPQQGFPMGQPGLPGQFQPQFQGGFPGNQGAPFGMNPNQQMAFNPMFNMPDVDDDLDD